MICCVRWNKLKYFELFHISLLRISTSFRFLQVFDYTPVDVAISRPLTQDNLEIVKVILECGGDAQHTLVTQYDLNDPTADQIQGPTLLHIVLAKKAETEFEEDVSEVKKSQKK